MAIAAQDDKLIDPNDPNAKQNQQTGDAPGGSGTSDSALIGSNSSAIQTGTPNAGVGAGGQGGWTNIQAYLGANKGVDTGATSILNEKIGGAFDKEKNDMYSSSKSAQDESAKQVGVVKDVYNQREGTLSDAAKNYRYSGGDVQSFGTPAPNQAYDTAVGKVRGALGAQYTAPKTWDYSFSNDAQAQAAALGSDDAFNRWLGDQYQNKAGGQLSAGGRALQTQLNISNDPLSQARQNLLSKWASLGDERALVAKQTGDVLKQNQQDFVNSQGDLNTWLSNQLATNESNLAKAESDARYGYQTAYGSGSGRRAAPLNYESPGGATNEAVGGLRYQYRNAGLLKDDMAWKDLQAEKDKWGHLYEPGSPNPSLASPYLGANQQALQNFYVEQDQKYADTGDQEKRAFNSILDMLNRGDARKKKGFAVRG